MTTYELAKVAEDGSFELMGDYPDRDSAFEVAKAFGPGEYAGSPDPDSGHYEETIEVHPDGTATWSAVGQDGRIYEATA